MALRATTFEMALAGLPDCCPSESTKEIPPPGRSIISSVSPLSEVAYLPTLATATAASTAAFYIGAKSLSNL